MTNLRKLHESSNPLINFEMWKELDQYNSIRTDEELAAFYHKLLDRFEDESQLRISFTYAMIEFSVGGRIINPQLLI